LILQLHILEDALKDALAQRLLSNLAAPETEREKRVKSGGNRTGKWRRGGEEITPLT